MSYWERFKKLKDIIAAIFKGILGIATEVGFTLTIMLIAFFICILAISF